MTTSLTLSDLRIAVLLPLLALTTACPGKDGLLTAHEGDESSSGPTGDPTGDPTGGPTGDPTGGPTGGPTGDPTDTDTPDTDTAADTGSTDETGECETACTPEPEPFACPRGLVWSGGLLGMTIEPVEDDCRNCENSRVGLLMIDPVSAQHTLLGQGPIGSVGHAFTVAGDGSIFVAGTTNATELQGPGALLLKFSPAGELSWQVAPDGDQMLRDVVVRDEEVIVVGYEHELLAFSVSDGAPLWDVPGHDGSAGQIELDAEGALYVAGSDPYPGGGALPSWYLRKYVGEGALLWDHTSPMLEGDRPNADGLAFDEAGGVVVGVRNDPFAASPDSIAVHKLSVDGELAWSRPLPDIIPNFDTDDTLNDLISRPGGGVIVVGGAQADDVGYTVALDPDGEPLWQDLQQGGGLVYVSNWGAAIVAGELLVSGCGSTEANDIEGWLLHLTP